MKRHTIITVIVGATIGAAVLFMVQRFILSPSTETTLLQISNEFNRQCPMMVDKITRFDNTSVNNHEFRFSYTILNAVKDSVDTLQLRHYLEPVVRQGITNNPRIEFLRQNRIIISCLYKDKNGIKLTEIKVATAQ
jgi:hypothetical protein